MKARGSITQLLRNRRPGYIQGEDGCLVAFDESALVGLDPRELSVGDWVECSHRFRFTMPVPS